MGCVANQNFTEGEVIEQFYGTLVFQFNGDVLNARGIQEECRIVVSREPFHISAIRLAKEVSSSNEILYIICLLSARITCL